MKVVSKLAAGAARKLGLRDPLLRLTSSRYRRLKAVADEALGRIDGSGVEAIRQKFSPDDIGYKYTDFAIHIEEMVDEADRLGLLNVSPTRVLGLGSGSGIFLHVLRCAGHDVMGLDLDEIPCYKAMIDQQEIPRTQHRIERYQPLPDEVEASLWTLPGAELSASKENFSITRPSDWSR